MKILKLLNVFLRTNHLVLTATLPIIRAVLFFPISYLIYLFFTTRQFPKFCKIAKVMVLFRKEDPLDCSNCRPISLLSTFSKLFEKCVFKHVYSFLDKNKLTFKHQFGFRSGYSSNQIIVNLVESIKKCIMIIMCAVYLDILKKFLIL